MSRHRLPTVGVMGSSTEEHAILAEPLGGWIAQSGWNLLTGGRTGVMEAAARGFCGVEDRPGRSIGILPAGCEPNPYVEIPIFTHLSAENDMQSPGWRWSRNHINVRSADALVALPGGAGTASELELAVSEVTRRPCVVFLGSEGSVNDLVRTPDGRHLVTREGRKVQIATTLDEVAGYLRDHLWVGV